MLGSAGIIMIRPSYELRAAAEACGGIKMEMEMQGIYVLMYVSSS